MHATRSALKTMKFRDERKLNEKTDYRYRLQHRDGSASDEKYESLPGYDKFNSVCEKDCLLFVHPDPDRGLMVYCDIGAYDCHGMMASMTEEEYFEAYIGFIEPQ